MTWRRSPPCSTAFFITVTCSSAAREAGAPKQRRLLLVVRSERGGRGAAATARRSPCLPACAKPANGVTTDFGVELATTGGGTEIKKEEPLINLLGDSVPKPLGFSAFAPECIAGMARLGRTIQKLLAAAATDAVQQSHVLAAARWPVLR